MYLTVAEHDFVFKNKIENLYPFVNEVTGFIGHALSAEANRHRVISKTKLLLTELLTNAIKHAGENEVIFKISLNDGFVNISKTDTGTPFYLNTEDGTTLYWPLNADVKGTLKIYSDGLNGLFAKIINPYQLTFYTEEYEIDMNAIPDIAEHYGLMIISKLTEDFVYQYDKDTRLNIFKLRIRY